MKTKLLTAILIACSLMLSDSSAQMLDATVSLDGSFRPVLNLHSAATFQFTEAVAGGAGFSMIIDEAYCADAGNATGSVLSGSITYNCTNTASGSVGQFGSFGFVYGMYTIRDEEVTVTTPPSPTFSIGDQITFNAGTITGTAPQSSAICTNSGPYTAFIVSDDYLRIAATQIALPVELTAFDLTANDERVAISWTTESESNNERFLLERSGDQQSWTLVKELPGAGTSTTTRIYETTDDNPIEGVAYYRLRQIDYDGTTTQSGYKTVTFQRGFSGLSLYPNPASSQVNIELAYVPEDPVKIAVYNTMGQVMTVGEMKDVNATTLDVEEYAPGLYFVELTKGHHVLTKRFYVH